MSSDFNETARLVGIVSASAVAVLLAVYAITLGIGLLRFRSQGRPIGGRLFLMLELLIVAIAPAAVMLMAAVHAWAPSGDKVFSLLALVFMALVAGLTCSVHFVILTLGRRTALRQAQWWAVVFDFKWPSVVYALDILAWDVFFALSMGFAAPVFSGSGLADAVRALMIVSAVFAFAGLSGVVANDMRLRNIGIVGYVGLFLVVNALLVVLFWRADPNSFTQG
jgi:hypothetical protein